MLPCSTILLATLGSVPWLQSVPAPRLAQAMSETAPAPEEPAQTPAPEGETSDNAAPGTAVAPELESAGPASEQPGEELAQRLPAQHADVATEVGAEEEPAREASALEELPDQGAPVEDEPALLNPRPAGEAAMLDKHPIGGSTYKPGTGAQINSEDGLFSLGLRARVQIRDELYSYSDASGSGEAHLENTFGLRRARLQLKGHMFGEHNKYKAEFAFSPSDLGYKNGSITRTPLLTYYVEFDYLRDLSLRLGQYKLYYSRQRVISSGDLEMVDRTAAQTEFNLDRDVGFHFYSKDLGGWNFLKYYAGITVGEGRDIWLAEDITQTDVAGAQYLARVELLPFGDFKDYSEVDFERLNKFRLSIGAAYAFLDNGFRTRGYQGQAFEDGGRVDYHNVNADLFFKWAGMTGLVEFYLREGQRGSAAAPGDLPNLARSGIGGSVQLGYLLPGLPLGIVGRYSTTSLGPYSSQESALRSTHELGGGVSWFVAGHPLKLQADYFRYWGDQFAGTDPGRLSVQLQVAY